MDLAFNFTDKLFQPSVHNKILKTLTEDKCHPIVVEIDPTSSCDQNCIWCISKPLLNKGEMPLRTIKDLLSIFKDINIEAIVFTGGGEPLLHSAMPKPLFLAKEMGFYLGLVTNGTLLYKYMHDLSGLVSWVRVSMDAGSSKTYERLHYNNTIGNANIFNKIIKGMETFARNKGKTKLGFSFLIYYGNKQMQEYTNVYEMFSACSMAKEIGCDYFEIKPYTNNKHQLMLSKEYIDDIKKQYVACKKLEESNFRVYCSESLQDILNNGLSFEWQHIEQSKLYEKCYVSRLRTMVTRDGIFPCPYFRGNKDKAYLFDSDNNHLTADQFLGFLDIASKKANPARDCKFYCIRHKQNIVMESMSNNLTNFPSNKEMKTLQDYDPFI